MALQKKVVDITFTKGVDTGRDPKLVIPTKFTRVENLETDRLNTLRQRPGFTAKTLTALGTYSVTGLRRLVALGDELLTESFGGLHSLTAARAVDRNRTSQAYTEPGRAFERGGITFEDIAESQQLQLQCDMARETVFNRYECHAWAEYIPNTSTLQVFYRVIDTTTNTRVIDGLLGNGYLPRVVCKNAGTQFQIYYVNAATVVGYVVTVDGSGVPTLAVSSPALAIHADGYFDAAWDQTQNCMYLALKSAAGKLEHYKLSVANATSMGPSGSIGATISAISVGVGVDAIGNHFGLAAFAEGGTAVKITSLDLSTGTVSAAVTVTPASSSGNIARIALCPDPSSALQALVFADCAGGYTAPLTPMNSDLNRSIVNWNGASVSTAGGNFARGVQLAGRPALYTINGSTDVAVPVAIESTLQRTLFLLKYGAGPEAVGFGSGRRVLARILPGEIALSSRLPTAVIPYVTDYTVAPTGNTTVRFPFLRRGRPVLIAGSDTATARVQAFTWTPLATLNTEESQRSLFLAGACPHLFDGTRVHEAGFNYYPEGVTAAVRAAGSMTLLGTYSFVMRYEWKDAKGVLHYSAPSVPVQLVLTGANASATLRFPFLRLTSKDGATTSTPDASDVKIAVFRTAASGTIYYRDVAGTGSDQWNTSSGLVMGTWISDISDTSLTSNEVLNADVADGSVDPEPFPSCRIICNHQTRLFMVKDGERNVVQYTDVRDEEFLAPITSSYLGVYNIHVPTEGGDITGLASMDEKLIIFCERRIYFVFGEGPNRLGTDNSYSLPQLCVSQVGLLAGAHESIVLTHDGLWFYSSQNGLRLLTRGLSLALEPGEGNAFLGREADGFFAAGISTIQARVADGKAQVRFYVVPASGSAFVAVWDYQQHIWTKFTGLDSAGGSAVAAGVFYHASTSAVYASGATAGTQDNGANYTCLVETGWISMAGVQGYQRVYQMMLLLEGLGATNISVETGFDYNESYTIVPTKTLATTTNNPVQLEFATNVQRCEAVRFRISWTSGSSELVRLTGMSLLIGVKGGLYRLPSSGRT